MAETPPLSEATATAFFLQKAADRSVAQNTVEKAAKQAAAAFLSRSAFEEFDRKKSDQRRYTPFFRLFSPVSSSTESAASQTDRSFTPLPLAGELSEKAEDSPFYTPLYSRPFTAPATALPENSFAALSQLLADQGADIALPAKTKAGPLLLNDHIYPDKPAPHPAFGALPDFHRHRRIHLAAEASLVLIEILSGEEAYLRTSLNEIFLEDGADLVHYRLITDSKAGRSVLNTKVRQEENTSYRQINAVFQGSLLLDETVTDLVGKGASAAAQTLLFLTGNAHADLTARVRHNVPATSSEQTVRSLVADQGFGAFRGQVLVAKHAQKTESSQLVKALLLSPTAQMNSRPELEIFADDVKCAHGSATGGLDSDQLFFLRSRGLNEQAARQLLSEAFFTEEILKIPHPFMQELLLLYMGHLWKDLSP